MTMKTILIILGILLCLFIWCCCKVGGDSDE
jgi:hypothetical protein